ncbi:WD40/YVTN repeat-like-containing domain [Penicillium digitatum]|uniref:WD40/YVTN repeat-like-containing domain n=1 Tax=Penicillium digitatum TaxID=36651 RepID=A0A7T7BJM2_PENDI|nr:WD40/YVTN repeat-like-containing domain [Penicillium digitatum]
MDASTGPGAPSNLCLSEDGLYAAHVSGKGLVVHSNVASENKEVQIARIKEIPLKSLQYFNLEKSPGASDDEIASRRRLLSVSDSRISVWQLAPLEMFAGIESVEPGVLAVEFGADENEVLVFHAWNIKLSVHSLETGRSSVIKTPKFAHHLGFGYRPKTRQLAILLKPETSDLLTVHEPRSYELVNRTVLPTIDAQGLKWSPDGKWIAIWDIASAGTKVLIFTADGQLFRTYSGSSGVDDSFDLGVKHIEWSPASRQVISETLAVGKVNGNVDLLRTRTFSSVTILSHVFQTDQPCSRIWRERYTTAAGDAEYAQASCSSALSMSPESVGPPRGVLTMTFSPDGRLLATVDTARQNVVWIWSLEGTPTLVSALVHEQPVRQIVWHPSTPQLLINTITNTLPAIRWWSPTDYPLIARVPIQRSESGKYDVRWVAESNADSPFWFSSAEQHVIGYLSTCDGAVEFEVLNSVTSKSLS